MIVCEGFPPPHMMWPGMFPPQAGAPPPPAGAAPPQAGAPPPQGAAPPPQGAAPATPQAPLPQQGTDQPGKHVYIHTFCNYCIHHS